MKTFIAITLCVCLLLAPLAQAQSAGLVDSVIKGCQGSSGLNGILCKGAVSLGEQFCKSPGGGGNCIKFVTDLCRKNAQVCRVVSGPLCKATGTYATECDLAVKAALSPAGGIVSDLASLVG